MRTIIALILAALFLGGPAVAFTLHVQDNQKVTECANNLIQLWKMQHNYMVQYGGSHKLLPLET
ncbi:uncharacterized protein METZ01_LOCUS442843, partial [marine metagenome]